MRARVPHVVVALPGWLVGSGGAGRRAAIPNFLLIAHARTERRRRAFTCLVGLLAVGGRGGFGTGYTLRRAQLSSPRRRWGRRTRPGYPQRSASPARLVFVRGGPDRCPFRGVRAAGCFRRNLMKRIAVAWPARFLSLPSVASDWLGVCGAYRSDWQHAPPHRCWLGPGCEALSACAERGGCGAATARGWTDVRPGRGGASPPSFASVFRSHQKEKTAASAVL